MPTLPARLATAALFAAALQATVHAGPHVVPNADVTAFARRAVATGDAQHQPFAVLDKQQARLFIYRADGRLAASTPVLLGLARGDDSVPGIGERPIAQIRPGERTTPAGRFIAEPGRNTAGEDIVWIDYGAAISMHRVRATNPAERRLQRLASATADDNRISYGCINVPAAFYDAQVKPVFGQRRAIVYVLPEASSPASHFAFLRDGSAD